MRLSEGGAFPQCAMERAIVTAIYKLPRVVEGLACCGLWALSGGKHTAPRMRAEQRTRPLKYRHVGINDARCVW